MFIEMLIADALQREEKPRTPPSKLAGRWRNRLGSVMQVTVDENHRVDGSFTSGVGASGRTCHLVGYAEGDALSFCVDFGRLGSVAAWAGHRVADDQGERLVTLWHLALPVREPHSDADVWGSVSAGGDEFTRLAT